MDLTMSRASFSEKILFWGGVLFFAVVFFLIIFSKNGVLDLHHLNREKQSLLHSVDEIERSNQVLIKEINLLKHDLDYIAHFAKHELGMAAENDLVFRIVKKTGRE